MPQPDSLPESKGQRGSPNPFGYADHSPFGAFGAELVYGERPDGTLAHVSEAAKGLACDCICPACGRTLVAVKGHRVMEHFRHHGKNSGCGKNAETNAHSWAKEVLGRELQILLPGVGAHIGKEKLQTHKERMFRFVRAEHEKTLDDIVPDVVLTTADGQQLLVEVMVTHPCGPEKIAKLRDRGLATLEVDMSSWRRSSDRQQIEDALIEWAPRAWLYNRKLDDAEERLRLLIAEREAREAEAERRRQERAAAEVREREARRQRELDSQVDSVRQAVAAARRSRSDAGRLEFKAVQRDPVFRSLLLARRHDCGFLVPAERWQAAILERIVRVPVDENFILPQFGVETALRVIQDCVHPHFYRGLAEGVQSALPEGLRQQTMPRHAVQSFLHHLCDQGILQGDGLGGFEIADDRAEALEAAHEAWQLRARRRRAIDRAMEKILQAIPAEERAGFSPERWQRHRIPGFDRVLDAIVESEPEVWKRFDHALLAIERMVDGGEAAAETLGLPLSGEIERARERAREQARREAGDREQRLRSAAYESVGAEAAGWLIAAQDGSTPGELARASEDGLAAALRALAIFRSALAAKAAADAVAARCRAELKADADKALGLETANWFLGNYDARLKASPWDVCIDGAGLRLARIELGRWVERQKRSRRR